jgi:hypothetical protein
MRQFGLMVTILAAVFVMTVGTVWAGSGLKLCVPRKEGSATLTPKHGVCKKGYSLTRLGVEGKQGAAGGPGAEGRAGSEGKQGPEGKSGFTAGEAEQLKALLAHLRFVVSGPNGKPAIQFTGVNLQVLSGAGETEGAPNGMGNVIIGYDESPQTQTGSHNLVLGTFQSFTSFGGILAGTSNTMSKPYASVVGGRLNTANGEYATVSGGESNSASGEYAAVAGGLSNHAIGSWNSVMGGQANSTHGFADAILGGESGTLASNSKCGTIPTGATTC